MGPTPIHVRGKRKLPPTTTTTTTTGGESSQSLQSPPKMLKTLAEVRASRSTRRRASLSSLPVDVLESIFLYSGNLSLPRSSDVIGAKLSRKAIRLLFFMMCFDDMWSVWFGSVCWDDLKGVRGNPDLQSELLLLPWVDLDFLLQVQQLWAGKFATDVPYERNVPFPVIDENGQEATYWGYHTNIKPGLIDLHAIFLQDYATALEWPAFYTSGKTWGSQDVHPRARMPPHLLEAPWDEEKKKHLFWMTRGGLQLGRWDPEDWVPWELKVQCLENVIINAEKPDNLVLNCLIGVQTFVHIPRDAVRDIARRVDTRVEWGDDSPETKDILRKTKARLFANFNLSKKLY